MLNIQRVFNNLVASIVIFSPKFQTCFLEQANFSQLFIPGGLLQPMNQLCSSTFGEKGPHPRNEVHKGVGLD